MTLRVGVAGISGAWSTERLRSALEGVGAAAFTFDLAECSLDLPEGAVWWEGRDLGALDGVVVKKLGVTTDPLTPSRVHVLRQLEFRGVRVFSPAQAIAEANDRYRMSQRLSQAEVPIPRTVITESIDEAAQFIVQWKRVVVKPLFTSKGRGMLLLSRERTHRLKLRRWRREWQMPFYLQEYIPHPGRDVGVVVLDGQVLGAYYRVARPSTWITTTSAGGHYEPCPVGPEMERPALQASELFDLDFTGVDLVEGPDGYLVYEVSAFGGFAGLWQAQGFDAAPRYAEYIVRTLTDRRRHERASVDPSHIPA